MNFNKTKKNMILLIVLVASVGIIAVSFAYFVVQLYTAEEINVNLSSGVLENLTFTPGEEMILSASVNNFNETSGSINTVATSTAKLIPDVEAGSASSNYNVYLHIQTNEFIYTQNTETPELLVKITNPSGEELKLIDGVTHKTVLDADGEELSGFDITTYIGLLQIASEYQIETTNATEGTTQTWNVELIFVNYNADQNANKNKSLSSFFILQKEDYQSLLSYKILENNDGEKAILSKTEPDFSVNATVDEGVFASQDDYGISYYFRGAVDDNWVYFAGFYWRIIRINGDGSIRMIYSGPTKPTEDQKVTMLSNETSIGNSLFNASYTTAKYAGYMYDDDFHGLKESSNIKTYIDQWYETNIYNSGFHSYVSDTLFCGDRTAYTDYSRQTPVAYISFRPQYFGSSDVALTCPNKLDAYTVNDDTFGNSSLTFPVSTISFNEVLQSGMYWDNQNHYLLAPLDYWTLSPKEYNLSSRVENHVIYSNGNNGGTTVNSSKGVRPVISLKSNTIVTGNGTWNEPYTVN